MKKVFRFWKVILIDLLGVTFMLAGLVTGWLPGPGGIPLFIIGLSLLAINHTWAERYIELLKSYADRLGDLIFIKNSKVEWAYDALVLLLLTGGGWLLYQHAYLWQVSVAISLIILGLMLFFGNRGRWPKIKAKIKHMR